MHSAFCEWNLTDKWANHLLRVVWKQLATQLPRSYSLLSEYAPQHVRIESSIIHFLALHLLVCIFIKAIVCHVKQLLQHKEELSNNMAFGNSDIFLLMSFSAISLSTLFQTIAAVVMHRDRQPDKWLCLLLNRNRTGNRPFLVLHEFCDLHEKPSPSCVMDGGTQWQRRPWLPLAHICIGRKKTSVLKQSHLPPGIMGLEGWVYTGLQRASHCPFLAHSPPPSSYHSTPNCASKCDSFVFVSCLFLIN